MTTDQGEHQNTMRAAEALAARVAANTIRTGPQPTTTTNSAIRRGLLSGAVAASSLPARGERAAHAARTAFGRGNN